MNKIETSTLILNLALADVETLKNNLNVRLPNLPYQTVEVLGIDCCVIFTRHAISTPQEVEDLNFRVENSTQH